MGRLDDKVTIITGAARGQGACEAALFAAEGAIVYATDARLARRARTAFEIPATDQPRIRYVGALLEGAREVELARAFLSFLTDGEGRATLAAAGFAPPGDGPADTAR